MRIFPFQKVSQTRKCYVFQALINIKMLLKVFTKKIILNETEYDSVEDAQNWIT